MGNEGPRDSEVKPEDTERKSTSFLKTLGPGLITGASDDDPTGIAAFSQAGAQFGTNFLYIVFFTYPLMAAVQSISAMIGRVTGRGLASNMYRNYSKPLMAAIVSLMVIANVINLGADIGAMGEAGTLLIGWPAPVFAVLFALTSLALQIFMPYARYANILKWFTLTLFCYVLVIFFIHVDWIEVLHDSFLPAISLTPEYLTMLIGVLGTTLSPYLFFWQASQEVEEVRSIPERTPLKKAPEQAPNAFDRIRLDTLVGMGFSNAITFFIILSTGITLHTGKIRTIESAAQAAEALRPLAGNTAYALFAFGILGTGLLAIPVLGGSAAYAISELFKWKTGLGKKPHQAKGFYGILVVATLLGMGIIFTKINPIRALFWSAVFNGIVAGPAMIAMMFIASNKKIMGNFTISRTLKILGWIATGVMLAASIGLFVV